MGVCTSQVACVPGSGPWLETHPKGPGPAWPASKNTEPTAVAAYSCNNIQDVVLPSRRQTNRKHRCASFSFHYLDGLMVIGTLFESCNLHTGVRPLGCHLIEAAVGGVCPLGCHSIETAVDGVCYVPLLYR